MNAMQVLAGPVAQAIGWALLHLLWQGTIVAGILAAVLALLSRRSANARYAASCTALAIVFVMFVGTAVRSYDPGAAPIAAPATAITAPADATISLSRVPIVIAASAAATWRQRADALVTSARNSLPLIVALWLLGVVVLSSRLLVSWMRARRLATHGASPANADWQRIAARLSDALGLRAAVRLLESAAVEVPSVLGTIRPVILLPASALTGLTADQIEMVLAHELAHIRRHDFFVNLLQAFVETLMFYHPAIWWMSRRVRIERENCCDDLAVAVCGDALRYARALARLEELRAAAPDIVVAANGGSLIDRVRRIVTGRAESIGLSSRWAAAVAMLSLLTIALAVPSLPALAQREEKKAEKKAEQPKKAATVVEVRASHDEDNDVDDVDVDVDNDTDIESPETPEPPEMPEAPDIDIDSPYIPTPAPMAVVAPAIAAARAPRAPRAVPTPHPSPAIAPLPPTPMAMVMAGDNDFDYDYDYEYDDDHDKNDRPLDATGKLTVDELISLRAVGVTPDYIKAMREIFPGLTVRNVSSLKAVGVTPEFVKQMRSAGFEVKTAREATSLRAVGVTPEYVQQMRSAGLAIGSAHEATSLRAVGVTPEFVSAMRAAGFEVKDAHDATSLRAVGVTADWVRDMKAAGVEIRTAKDATTLRAVGVTPEFVSKLSRAGYTNLTARELARLAAAGVDDDFIREMEQYRKK